MTTSQTVSQLAAAEKSTPARSLVTAELVILSVHSGQVRLLTVQDQRHQYRNQRTLPVALLGVGETLREAAVRVLATEFGIALAADDLVEIGSASDPQRDPSTRIVAIAFGTVLANCPAPNRPPGNQGHWTLLDAALDDPSFLAIDHHDITRRATWALADRLRAVGSKGLPTVTAVNTATQAFVSALRQLDVSAFGQELHDLRKSELGEVLAGLDGVRDGVRHLFAEATDEVNDFIGSSEEANAVLVALDESGETMEALLHQFRPVR